MNDISLPMSAEAVIAYARKIDFLPLFEMFGMRIAETGDRYAKTTVKISQMHKRIGDTVSGPTQFTAADTALYIATLATLGPVGAAVTSQLNIHFLKAGKGDILTTEAQILKVSKRTITGEMKMFMDDDQEPISVATGTYAVPAAS